jgi:transketolase
LAIGSLNQGSHKTHGEPLGEEDGATLQRSSMAIHYPEFTVPDSGLCPFAKQALPPKEARKRIEEWNLRYEAFKKSHPKESEGLRTTRSARNVTAVSAENADVRSLNPPRRPAFPRATS